jgi:hypothetical protein
MPKRVNSHVSRLSRYLPFHPDHSQLYEEHADPGHMRSIRTKACNSVVQAVKDGKHRLIVLTGNAGHGKTHLCRRVLEETLAVSPEKAHELISSHGKGQRSVGGQGARELFVVTDLSELTEEAGAELLCQALTTSNSTWVICANEGRLRKVASIRPETLGQVRIALESVQETGQAASSNNVIVVDLNGQSVTARVDDRPSFLDDLLQQWVMDGRSWAACGDCSRLNECPIQRNRGLLSGADEKSAGFNRRDGLHELLQVVEQTGVSITIRELLILMAFTITGGLDCKAVHSKTDAQASSSSWQNRHLFSQALFEPPIDEERKKSLHLLQVLRRLDPGKHAIRAVDDVLASTQLPDDLEAAGISRAATGTAPKSRKEAAVVAASHKELFRYLRRLDFFNLATGLGERKSQSRSARLGFRFYDTFSFLIATRDLSEKTVARDKVLRGLEAVQDVRLGRGERSRFAIVDPAFANTSSNASVLSELFPAKSVLISGITEVWRESSSDSSLLPDLVDWIDRMLVVRFKDRNTAIKLNLLAFEFVMRSAEGLSCRNFFRAEIRRINAGLARISQDRSSEDESITVAFEDNLRHLSIDEGNKIKCEEGAA